MHIYCAYMQITKTGTALDNQMRKYIIVNKSISTNVIPFQYVANAN